MPLRRLNAKQFHQPTVSLSDNIDNVVVSPDNHVAPLSIGTNIVAAMTVLADTVNSMQSKMGDILQTFQSQPGTQPLPSLGTANTEDNLVNEQYVNDNAINQNISQIVPEHVLYECAEKYQLHHTLALGAGVSEGVKRNIWDDEYVEFADLLPE